jgi:phosphoribosyl 1,2-cyclic phosphodiesterase
MEVAALASGSSGNCFYVGNGKNGILIDAGISAKQIKERLAFVGKNAKDIQAIFITHEHSDHVRGADVFAREFEIPLYATKKTALNCFLCSNDKLINLIKNTGNEHISGMDISAFPKSHKAADPVSFSICAGKKISIITDAGHCCNNVAGNVSDSDFLFLESNHDLKMLEEGPYPHYLKKWIKSDAGHLSNRQAGLCVLEHASSQLKHVVLSHLSQTNNTPQLALATFKSLLKERFDLKTEISVSERETPTKMFRV